MDLYSLGIITYFLLSGTMPFLGNTEQEIARNIIKCDLTFKAAKWRAISKEGLDFCKSKSNFLLELITKNVNSRIDYKEILKHDFIKM